MADLRRSISLDGARAQQITASPHDKSDEILSILVVANDGVFRPSALTPEGATGTCRYLIGIGTNPGGG
jgi:hypothetical protein